MSGTRRLHEQPKEGPDLIAQSNDPEFWRGTSGALPGTYDTEHSFKDFPTEGLIALGEHRQQVKMLREADPEVSLIEGLEAAEQDPTDYHGAVRDKRECEEREQKRRLDKWRITERTTRKDVQGNLRGLYQAIRGAESTEERKAVLDTEGRAALAAGRGYAKVLRKRWRL